MAESAFRFPFGQPVDAFTRADLDPREVFVLGAYLSALHVAWTSPDGRERIRALPVDNEPEPFWDGHDEPERIASWKNAVSFDEAQDGSVSGVGKLNGSSGVALDQAYLKPLGIDRSSAWVTDCLPTYYASTDVARAIAERFVPAMIRSTRPTPELATHPSEGRIVKDAAEPSGLSRLQSEFVQAQARIVITLGNAAARVLRKLVELDVGPTQLTADEYGKPVRLAEGKFWHPLAHPGVIRREPWRAIHARWVRSQG